ncbi:MAG TPA: molybdenum ABC transporter ATP-binding protein [Burkholderiaceae bacterium]|nr:molybdenum ABC transporter ATP-binding protein [Burkholderiaceae bacterium]
MSGLRIRAHLALRTAFTLDVDTQLPGQGITAIFGPSGCGKTTLLRAVAGLARPSPGQVSVNGETWQDDARGIWLPAHRRALGFVFQDARLFPHLTVRGNLDFGLRRVPPNERRIALDQAVELLGIGGLMERLPAQLSGGQRQRVAIARALAVSPRLLLLDEPLAALDTARKAEVLPYFERLQRELAIPLLYVTHAIDEVARLADETLLMEAGRAVAQGPTMQLLTRLDLSLAREDAASAVIDGTIESIDAQYQLMQVRFSGGQLLCVTAPGQTRAENRRVRLRVQARDVSLALERACDSSVLNILPAVVTELRECGPAQTMAALDLGGTTLLARITRKSADALALVPGKPVFAQIKGVAVLD